VATRAVPAVRSQAASGGRVADSNPGPAPTRIAAAGDNVIVVGTTSVRGKRQAVG
jgi:hypothetical protein